MFSLAQGRIPQIFTVAIEEIEGRKARLAWSEKQCFEVGLSLIDQRDNLTIQHGGRRCHFRPDAIVQSPKGFELVPIARNQLASPVLDSGERPESIEFDFENPVRMRETARVCGQELTARRQEAAQLTV